MDFEKNFKDFLSDRTESKNDNLKQKEMQDVDEDVNKSKASSSLDEEQSEFDKQASEILKLYKTTVASDILEGPVKQKTPSPRQPIRQQRFSTVKEKEFKITFHDLPEVSGQMLDIIYHTPKFELPITTNPYYQKFTTLQRAKLLSDYYTRVDKYRARIARDSLYRAPYPKPILPSYKCKNSLQQKNGLDDITDQIPVQELYVSRAGRQVKRKIYTEDAEGDSDSDFMYSVKKNKADDSDMKITLDTPYVPEESHQEEKPKTPSTKDSQKRNFLSTKNFYSRSEQLAEKAKQDEVKKRQQQEEIDIFEKSLTQIEEADDEGWLSRNSPVKNKQETEDSEFSRIRVVPPIPTKKGRAKKAAKEDANKKETKPESPPGSPVLKRYSSITKSTKQKTQKKKSTEEVGTKIQKTPCPICNREFIQSEIENHAANCGIEDEDMDVVTEGNRSPRKKISCELCEQEFTMNTDFEIHVKQCIASKVTDL